MDFQFSEIHNGTKVAYSPDGTLIATVDRNRVRIHDTDSMSLLETRTNPDECTELEWSPDGRLLLCTIVKKKSVQIWAREDTGFSCTIDEGLAGLTHAEWAGDSRHVITSSEFQIRLTIWMLEQRKAKYIKFPKFSKKGIAQSYNRKYLAVVERREHRDYIGVYRQGYWELINRFKVDTIDLEDIMWSTNDRVICCYDNPLEYRFLIYTPRGQKLAQFQAYENALGIKSLSFSPKSRFLAVGSYDQICRVFNNLTWRSLADYEHKIEKIDEKHITPAHKKILDSKHKRILVYQEEFSENQHQGDSEWYLNDNEDDNKSDFSGTTAMTNFTMTSNLLRKTVRSAKVPTKKGNDKRRMYILKSYPPEIKENKVEMVDNPKVGVSKCEWSPNGQLLATLNDNMPMTVWIWTMPKLGLLSIVDHKDPISSFKWAPGKLERLAICCGNDRLYLWSKSGSVSIRCQASRYVVSDLQWCPDGESILLLDKKKFCVCYFRVSSTTTGGM